MLKVAFATDDRISVNQHFGAAVGFAIYALDGERARLVQVAEFPAGSRNANEDNASAAAGHPEPCNQAAARFDGPHKLADKIAALAGCSAVYCLAVGGSAVRQLLAGGIQPMRLDGEVAIESLLVRLRTAIREGGIAWIDRLVKRTRDNSRFDRMAEEGWQE